MNKKLTVVTDADIEVEISRQKVIADYLSKCRELQIPKTEKELKERIESFFRFCSANNIIPSIELLSASLSTTRISFYRWCCGTYHSKEWQRICLAARQSIYANTEQCGLSGEISVPLSIFLLKAYGYSDETPLDILALRHMDVYGEEETEPPKAIYERYKTIYLENKSEQPDADILSDLASQFMNVDDAEEKLPEWL